MYIFFLFPIIGLVLGGTIFIKNVCTPVYDLIGFSSSHNHYNQARTEVLRQGEGAWGFFLDFLAQKVLVLKQFHGG